MKKIVVLMTCILAVGCAPQAQPAFSPLSPGTEEVPGGQIVHSRSVDLLTATSGNSNTSEKEEVSRVSAYGILKELMGISPQDQPIDSTCDAMNKDGKPDPTVADDPEARYRTVKEYYRLPLPDLKGFLSNLQRNLLKKGYGGFTIKLIQPDGSVSGFMQTVKYFYQPATASSFGFVNVEVVKSKTAGLMDLCFLHDEPK